jgi:HNH endonuclease
MALNKQQIIASLNAVPASNYTNKASLAARWGLSTKDRFEQYAMPEPNTGCFNWTGFVDPDGYGRFKWNKKSLHAQRAAWMIYMGDPKDKHVLHKCDNPSCVNPEHLFLGSHQDNMADKSAKGRCADVRGKLNPNYKDGSRVKTY